MAKILAIGEALFDCFSEQKILGGAPLNFAIHAVQLGAQVSLLTRIGQDPEGKQIIDTLTMRGVDIEFVQWDKNHHTGRVLVDFAPEQAHEPNYEILEDVAWDYLEYSESLAIALANYDCVYFGTLAQRNSKARDTINRILHDFRGFKILDLNLRKPFVNLKIIEQSIAFANGLKLNLAEAKYLQEKLNFTTNIQEWLTNYNLDWIVLTQGELGTTWIDKKGKIKGDRVIMTPDANADAVGAGDGVCAVVVSKYLDGASPFAIVQQANQIGAYIASQQGATPLLPLNLLLTAIPQND